MTRVSSLSALIGSAAALVLGYVFFGNGAVFYATLVMAARLFWRHKGQHSPPGNRRRSGVQEALKRRRARLISSAVRQNLAGDNGEQLVRWRGRVINIPLQGAIGRARHAVALPAMRIRRPFDAELVVINPPAILAVRRSHIVWVGASTRMNWPSGTKWRCTTYGPCRPRAAFRSG